MVGNESYGVKLSTDYETFKTCPTPYLGDLSMPIVRLSALWSVPAGIFYG